MTPVVYLHGFASGPHSKKARFFCERFAAHGVAFDAPDLAEGDFDALTLTRQLAVVERAVGGRRVHLMGSSMGGYLAALYAASHPAEVKRAVLLAPAFDFAARWRERLGAEAFADWETTGKLNVYHYAQGREASVGFQLYQDALSYPAYPAVAAPTPVLIFHGRHDDVVPYQLSERFAADRPNVRLRVLNSDHELVDSTELMWEETWAFLQPPQPQLH